MGTIFEGLVHTFVECIDYTYAFDDKGNIYRRDVDGFWLRVYQDPHGAIKGANKWQVSSGKQYLYWANDTLLERKEIPGLDNWNDVENVGELQSADWHTITRTGGALTIANSEFIAYVGFDESFTPEATDLIPGNVAKTIVERNGRAIIGTVNACDPSKGVNGAIDTEVPLAQVGEDGEIFFANMVDSQPVTRFPGGGKVNPGGVTNEVKEANFFEWEEGASSWIDKQSVGNLALFGVYNADSGKNGVYSYGRKRKNHPFVLNMDYEVDVDEIGALVDVNGTLLISYQDGADYGVRATDPNNKATGVYEGLDFKAPMKRPQDIANWKMVELLFSALPNGSSIEFWYKLDKDGSFIRARVDDGQPSFSTGEKNKAVFFIGANAQIFEPRIVLNPFGNYSPEVHRVRVYFN